MTRDGRSYGADLGYVEKRRAQRTEGVRAEGYVVNARAVSQLADRVVVKREIRDARWGRRRPAAERATQGEGARKARRRAARERTTRRYAPVWKEVDRELRDRTRRRRTPEAKARREDRARVKTKHAWPKTRTASARAGAVVLRYEWTRGDARTERRGRALAEGRKHKERRAYVDRRRKKAWERKAGRGRRRGYRLEVKGTLNGARRTRRQVSNQGTVPRSRRRAHRGVSRLHAKTKVGTMGVRRTTCYAGEGRGRGEGRG